MRDEREMYALILGVAKSDERIRAVILNGSRANPKVNHDIFQDFDIVYIVTDVDNIKNDPDWHQQFGELMIMQRPDDMHEPSPDGDGSYAYLMQLMDGNRVDLTLYPVEKLDRYQADSLSVLLLDKDGLFQPFPPPNESDYLPKPPTAKAFADCCNEFWWVCPYVAKGLWRREIVYAKHMLDVVVRKQLMQMLAWYVGIKTAFSSNPGKFGKHLEQHLEAELWKMLLETYADSEYEKNWDALFVMTDLFRIVSVHVAEHFGFEYPYNDDEKVSAHLKHVHQLPGDAKRMY
ncbi:MAG: aminoglycoside 6-adenylyltransferase [Anaerolineae bacterium]|nr:MAG: aminoglycoside 6-adenylyltransferase [Anaerolineae bacterium]